MGKSLRPFLNNFSILIKYNFSLNELHVILIVKCVKVLIAISKDKRAHGRGG